MPSPSPLTLHERIVAIRKTLPPSIRLIAVSKFIPVEMMRQAYAAGVRDFGESRVQEAIPKMADLKDFQDITWHFIGHLQSNKAKLAIEHFDWIHSVDSLSLAEQLNRLVVSVQESPKLCLQVKIVPDPNKFGWSASDLRLALPTLQTCSNLQWRGLMTLLPTGLTEHQALDVFRQTQQLAMELTTATQGLLSLSELSMGMSNDYPLAVQAGATMVRLGRCLFGDRPQP
ncbi:MAG: YggS family pyridoxal phosphate-dependent enzyme [Acaryochloris sp. RU_4_1]|nr:YggS family pyridoxal phosphate-dependent enzyme [Acaryochloris sp. SU_5_25]NJM65879.1 YggS family pyridoxal phosphate-dependent enzyme [Acaryochloris sp. RU_4_1]NJR56555.1 YggS family pyridoxal phosphate-dependent enzyme [Acaryochloris sp. CRU_2_0]